MSSFIRAANKNGDQSALLSVNDTPFAALYWDVMGTREIPGAPILYGMVRGTLTPDAMATLMEAIDEAMISGETPSCLIAIDMLGCSTTARTAQWMTLVRRPSILHLIIAIDEPTNMIDEIRQLTLSVLAKQQINLDVVHDSTQMATTVAAWCKRHLVYDPKTS